MLHELADPLDLALSMVQKQGRPEHRLPRKESIHLGIHLLSLAQEECSRNGLGPWVGGALFPRNLLTHFDCWPRDFSSFSSRERLFCLFVFNCFLFFLFKSRSLGHERGSAGVPEVPAEAGGGDPRRALIYHAAH